FGDSAGGSKDGTVMPAVRLFSKDPDRNVASLKSLEARLQPRAAEVRTLAFAHTGPLEGFAPLEAFARSHSPRECRDEAGRARAALARISHRRAAKEDDLRAMDEAHLRRVLAAPLREWHPLRRPSP